MEKKKVLEKMDENEDSWTWGEGKYIERAISLTFSKVGKVLKKIIGK